MFIELMLAGAAVKGLIGAYDRVTEWLDDDSWQDEEERKNAVARAEVVLEMPGAFSPEEVASAKETLAEVNSPGVTFGVPRT